MVDQSTTESVKEWKGKTPCGHRNPQGEHAKTGTGRGNRISVVTENEAACLRIYIRPVVGRDVDVDPGRRPTGAYPASGHGDNTQERYSAHTSITLEIWGTWCAGVIKWQCWWRWRATLRCHHCNHRLLREAS